jgi:hypothetical protein
MTRTAFLLLLAFLAACRTAPPTPSGAYDEAENLSYGAELGKARDLFKQAAANDPDPVRRQRAAIRAASLEWLVFSDAAAARVLLARVPDDSREAAGAWRQRAMLETELTHDFEAARTAARRAAAVATTRADRAQSLVRGAAASVEESRLARLGGKCADDRVRLRAAIADLSSAIETEGPDVESSRLLLDAALLVHDDATALRAWRWYYSDVPTLVPASIADRGALGLALAKARLFEEAELVLADPCAPLQRTADMQDVVTYAAMLRKVAARTEEHNRVVGRGGNDAAAFEKDLGTASQALWGSLSWPSGAPEFSREAFPAELAKRFGTVISLGKTEGIITLLLGHRVLDEIRPVEQYGQRANVHFILLDGITAGGYRTWATHGGSGTGGWTQDDGTIVQIRPRYADGPVAKWRRLADPERAARRAEEAAKETARDDERARQEPIRDFAGLELRMQKEYVEGVRDALAAQGLSGDALRDAFLERVRRDEFETSIWLHEGRHAIDKAIFKLHDANELEFRAKLSEVGLGHAPRLALPNAILSPVGTGGGPHAVANARVLAGAVAWMRAHAREIAGLDAARPLLPQLDKLTDEQLRAAFVSQDPLAVTK